MTTREVATIPRASLRYRVLSWFYKQEERFPETSCGVLASTLVQPFGYVASCLVLLFLGGTLLIIAVGMALGVGVWQARSIVPMGLAVWNLLLFAFAIAWPRLWWCYATLGVVATTIALSIDLQMTDLLLPGKFQLTIWGTSVGLYVAALLTIRWWLPRFRRLYAARCKPVTYV